MGNSKLIYIFNSSPLSFINKTEILQSCTNIHATKYSLCWFSGSGFIVLLTVDDYLPVVLFVFVLVYWLMANNAKCWLSYPGLQKSLEVLSCFEPKLTKIFKSSGFLLSVCVRWDCFQNFKRWGSLMFQNYSFIPVFKSNFQSGFYGSYHSSGQQQRGIWFEILGLCLNDITIQWLHKLYWQYMTVVNQNLSNAVEL